MTPEKREGSLHLFPEAPVTADASGPAPAGAAPLAERMRPRSLDEVVGQDHLVGPDGALRRLLDSGRLPSLIFWGPPGTGKTTLARLLAGALPGAVLESLSAVSAGVKDVRAVVDRALRNRTRTLLFLDEIHRFNRAQQDGLLPHVERGTITLIGATTENPSFEVVAPLLSRCRVYTLEPLGDDALRGLVEGALRDPVRGLGGVALEVEDDALALVVSLGDGDARRALGILDAAVAWARGAGAATLAPEHVTESAGRKLLRHDRDRDAHYDVISAMIKSLRASDPDAALYYAARLLEGGDDPRFVARRLVIFASEDIGNADPQALPLAMAAYQAVERIGLPEARINLGQALTYLACAPKSNAAYRAIDRALAAAREAGSAAVPMHLRNAPTGLMKGMGYGRGYEYPHDAPDAFVATPNLPEGLGAARFYEPSSRGAEAAIGDRLAAWRRRRDQRGPEDDGGASDA